MLTNVAHVSRLSDISVFVCVVKLKSFTAAAQKLDTSKSVISKYVSRLEERLGVKLLIRTTRRLTLTEIGRVYYDGVCNGLDKIGEAEQSVSVLQGTPRGRLKINAPLSFGILHISPLLSDFLEIYPEVQIDLNFDDHKINMLENGFDLTLRITKQLEGNLFARRLAPCRHVIVASPSYLKRYGQLKQPEDLVAHKVITYQYQESPREWEFESRNGNIKRVSVNSVVNMNNSLALREAALAGAGICRMPTFLAGEEIKAGRLIRLLPSQNLLELSIYLLFPERKNMAPKTRAFIDFMTTRLEGIPSWDRF
jgi:DNA-binding transcriptional LysR family regulator